MDFAKEAAKLKATSKRDWADAEEEDETAAPVEAVTAAAAPTATAPAPAGKDVEGKTYGDADIAELAKKLDLAAAASVPDLLTGELTVRQAGFENEGECSVEKMRRS